MSIIYAISSINWNSSKEFTNVRLKETKGSTSGTGRAKTAVFNPVASFAGKLQIDVRDEKARLRFDGRTKTNGWFWFTAILFLIFFLPLLLMLLIMYRSQKRRISTDMTRVKERMQFGLNEW